MMLFHLRYKKLGVKNFEVMAIRRNARYSHELSLKQHTNIAVTEHNNYREI